MYDMIYVNDLYIFGIVGKWLLRWWCCGVFGGYVLIVVLVLGMNIRFFICFYINIIKMDINFCIYD